MALSKPVTVTIVVTSVILGLSIVALIVVTAVYGSKKQSEKVKLYYKGEGVRMATAKRKRNTKPQAWCIGTFSRVLPGSVGVVQGATDVQTSQDLRPVLARGDPIKIGPQIFVVSQDMRRPFTASQLPLDTATMWVSEADGVAHPSPGRLLGPTNAHVTAYTCDCVELPYNTWTGPRGGAIGYWDDSGTWHEGDCPGACPQWYSPLFLGPQGKQMNAPSPGVLAKVHRKTMHTETETTTPQPAHSARANAGADTAEDAAFYAGLMRHAQLPSAPQQTRPPPPPQHAPPPPQYAPPPPQHAPPPPQYAPPPQHARPPPQYAPPPQHARPPPQYAPPQHAPPHASPQPQHPPPPARQPPPPPPQHPPMFSPLPPLF